MPVSNLSGFHSTLTLQNLTAFPKHLYYTLNNYNSLNRTLQHTRKIQRQKKILRRWIEQATKESTPLQHYQQHITPLKNKTTAIQLPSARPAQLASSSPEKPLNINIPVYRQGKALTVSASLVEDSPIVSKWLHTASAIAPLKLPPLTQGQPISTVTPSPVMTPRPKANEKTKTSEKNRWKPGRGTVEKIDKISGEIVHLSG